jgi:hypothetical protein
MKKKICGYQDCVQLRIDNGSGEEQSTDIAPPEHTEEDEKRALQIALGHA